MRDAMTRPDAGSEPRPCDPLPGGQYTAGQVLLHNVPYILMILLGAAVWHRALGGSAGARVAAAGYILYGAIGAVWIMVFVCPFCRFWGTHACPCGYGRIAARFRRRRPEERFNEKFRKHIPVIVPLWILPAAPAVPTLVREFTWGLMILLAVFALDAFVILPLFSTQHGCRECPQRQTCPWMGGKQS